MSPLCWCQQICFICQKWWFKFRVHSATTQRGVHSNGGVSSDRASGSSCWTFCIVYPQPGGVACFTQSRAAKASSSCCNKGKALKERTNYLGPTSSVVQSSSSFRSSLKSDILLFTLCDPLACSIDPSFWTNSQTMGIRRERGLPELLRGISFDLQTQKDLL